MAIESDDQVLRAEALSLLTATPGGGVVILGLGVEIWAGDLGLDTRMTGNWAWEGIRGAACREEEAAVGRIGRALSFALGAGGGG